MSMYRSRNERQKEKLATVFLWLLALGCAFYISWMINPHPIKQGIRWVGDQTEQFFDRCATQTLMQTLPSISCFFFLRVPIRLRIQIQEWKPILLL